MCVCVCARMCMHMCAYLHSVIARNYLQSNQFTPRTGFSVTGMKFHQNLGAGLRERPIVLVCECRKPLLIDDLNTQTPAPQIRLLWFVCVGCLQAGFLFSSANLLFYTHTPTSFHSQDWLLYFILCNTSNG